MSTLVTFQQRRWLLLKTFTSWLISNRPWSTAASRTKEMKEDQRCTITLALIISYVPLWSLKIIMCKSTIDRSRGKEMSLSRDLSHYYKLPKSDSNAVYLPSNSVYYLSTLSGNSLFPRKLYKVILACQQ